MGAMNFFETGKGKTPEEAFAEICAEAIDQYGNDCYNGTISTTELSGRLPHVIAKAYSEKSMDDGYEYAKADDFGQKWSSRCLDLGVYEYRIISTMKVCVPKDPPKYETRYVVQELGTGPRAKGKEIAAAVTKEKAEEIASMHSINYCTDVSVCKRKYLVSGAEETERFETSVKVQKKKPARVPKGAVVEEIHMYGFYGWAAC